MAEPWRNTRQNWATGANTTFNNFSLRLKDERLKIEIAPLQPENFAGSQGETPGNYDHGAIRFRNQRQEPMILLKCQNLRLDG